MRLPGAGLLIAIGLILLWLATTGKIDRLATAFAFVTGKTSSPDATPQSGSAPCDPSKGICDFSKFHTQSLMMSDVSLTNPGGLT